MKATPPKTSDEPLGAVKVAYDLEYVLPMQEAITVFQLLSKAQRVAMDYSRNIKNVQGYDPNLALHPVDQQKIKEFQLQKALELKDAE
jgi:hypothetical protein